MIRFLHIAVVSSALIVTTGPNAFAADQDATQTAVSASAPLSKHTPPSTRKARKAAATAPATRPGFASLPDEFAAAAAYENAGHDELAIPLYQELVQKQSDAPVGKGVKLDDGTGPRLGATVSDEAAHRLEVIATKERPQKLGALIEK